MGIVEFFKKIGHALHVAVDKIGHAFAATFVKLFGLEKAKAFADSAEALFETEFGQILLDAVQLFLAGVKAGTPYVEILIAVAKLIVTEAEKAGIHIAEDLAHFLANLVINKLRGNLAAVSKVTNGTPS